MGDIRTIVIEYEEGKAPDIKIPSDMFGGRVVGGAVFDVMGEHGQLLAMTGMLDCHPEGYDGPCLCATCRSYGD